jgi:hypothetical protein
MSEATQRQIVFELCRAARALGGNSDLIAAIGSWGDVQTDEGVLVALIKGNSLLSRKLKRVGKVSMRQAIRREIRIAFELLGADPELLGLLGGWGDRYDDARMLDALRGFNRNGTAFEDIDGG